MRLIDADALIAQAEEEMFAYEADQFAAMVSWIPTIDAVPVVRCAKCDWYDAGICVNPKCTKSWYGCRVQEQHFCSYGERRSE